MSINVLEPEDIYTEKVDRNGTKRYYKNGKPHRDGDEPAIIFSDGYKAYYKNGEPKEQEKGRKRRE